MLLKCVLIPKMHTVSSVTVNMLFSCRSVGKGRDAEPEEHEFLVTYIH